ncbi:MAG: hypothetical protein ABIJ40_18920 [Bacteroidota bacterium]
MKNKIYSEIVTTVCFVIFFILFFSYLAFGQSFDKAQDKDKPKQDSTMFKFWIEKYNTSIFELAQIDTFKIEKIGEIKFIVRQAQEEQQKLNAK